MSFEELLKEFEPTIKKLSRTYEIKPLESEDLAQELRLHLFEKYTLKVKEFNGWAYIVCRRKIVDLSRYYTFQKRDNRKLSSLHEKMENGFDVGNGEMSILEELIEKEEKAK